MTKFFRTFFSFSPKKCIHYALTAFLEQSVKKFLQVSFAACADMAVNEFSILEEEHGRNIHNAILLASVGVLIHIEFSHQHSSVVLCCEFVP